MEGLILRSEQITAGAATLSSDANSGDAKLKPSQIDDLVSIFRNYLGSIASRYPITQTLEAVRDTANSNRAAKLAACLQLWQDNQFDVSGFAATAANRTGFNDSTPLENYEIFKYAFGLFWDLPGELESRFTAGNSRRFGQGKFRRVD